MRTLGKGLGFLRWPSVGLFSFRRHDREHLQVFSDRAAVSESDGCRVFPDRDPRVPAAGPNQGSGQQGFRCMHRVCAVESLEHHVNQPCSHHASPCRGLTQVCFELVPEPLNPKACKQGLQTSRPKPTRHPQPSRTKLRPGPYPGSGELIL